MIQPNNSPSLAIFQHLANHNPFWSFKLTVHFQYNNNQLPTKCPILKETQLMSDPYLYHCNCVAMYVF